MDGSDAAAVVAAAIAGERWALTELFREYQPGLVRYLRSQEPSMADDLAGEVWVAVARRLAGFVGDDRAFRRWLFTIARNRLMDHRRTAARRRTETRSSVDFERVVDSRPTGDPAGLVVDGVSAQNAVDQLIADLSPSQGEVVLLRVVGGFGVYEVSEITGLSPGSVRVLQHRALKRLASRLAAAVLTE
jgi:RNA polymerase sigma-70 factor (ECF subfamily)